MQLLSKKYIYIYKNRNYKNYGQNIIRMVSIETEILAFIKVQFGKIIVYLKLFQIKTENQKLGLLILNSISITIYLSLQKLILLIKKL